MTFKPNPNIKRDVERVVVKTVPAEYTAALAKITCPDHDEHPTMEAHGDSWRINRCCEKAEKMALEAIGNI